MISLHLKSSLAWRKIRLEYSKWLANVYLWVYVDGVPVASVWLYYTCISLPDSGVCEETSSFCPWCRPGAKCVCCRLVSAGVSTHTWNQIADEWYVPVTHVQRLLNQNRGTQTKAVNLPCCWSFEGFWRECALCCPSPLVRGDGCGSEGPL